MIGDMVNPVISDTVNNTVSDRPPFDEEVVIGDWILENSVWDDTGVWKDSDTWND